MNWEDLTEEDKAVLDRLLKKMDKQKQKGETIGAKNRAWRSGIWERMVSLVGDEGRAYRMLTALYTIVNWKLHTRNVMKLSQEDMERADGIIGQLFEILEAKSA